MIDTRVAFQPVLAKLVQSTQVGQESGCFKHRKQVFRARKEVCLEWRVLRGQQGESKLEAQRKAKWERLS